MNKEDKLLKELSLWLKIGLVGITIGIGVLVGSLIFILLVLTKIV